MRVIIFFCSLICAVQCGDIMIKVIQEAHIGGCGYGCNKCAEAVDLGQLEAKKAELEGKVADAQEAQTAVSDAGTSVNELVDSVTSDSGRRRRRRSVDTASFTSCEDVSQTIDGTVESVILSVLDGIKAALDAMATGNLDPTKLNCYVEIAKQLTAGLANGTYTKPDATAITARANDVQAAVTSANAAVTTVLTNLQDELTQTNQAISSAGGSEKEKYFSGFYETPHNESLKNFTLTSENESKCDDLNKALQAVASVLKAYILKHNLDPYAVNGFTFNIFIFKVEVKPLTVIGLSDFSLEGTVVKDPDNNVTGIRIEGDFNEITATAEGLIRVAFIKYAIKIIAKPTKPKVSFSAKVDCNARKLTLQPVIIELGKIKVDVQGLGPIDKILAKLLELLGGLLKKAMHLVEKRLFDELNKALENGLGEDIMTVPCVCGPKQ